MQSDDVGFASVKSLRAREVPGVADPLVKKDTVEVTTSVEYGTDPDGAPVVKWHTHGKYRHDKHCPRRRPGAKKPCKCKHRHHHHFDPTGEGSHAHGSCSALAADPHPIPTPTNGNSTVTPTLPLPKEEVPSGAEPSPTTVES